MKSFLTQFTKQFATFFAALGAIVLVATLASAQSTWSGPTAAAPGGNVPAPINVGDDPQTKEGSLTVGLDTQSVVVSNGGVAANTLCLGTDCRSVWPGGGGGSVSSNLGTVDCFVRRPGRFTNFIVPDGFYMKGMFRESDNNWDGAGPIICRMDPNVNTSLPTLEEVIAACPWGHNHIAVGCSQRAGATYPAGWNVTYPEVGPGY